MTSAVRSDVVFYVRGVKVAAWFYPAPGDGATPGPTIVMAHGLGGVRSWRLDTYARAFQSAGYASLVFDYRGLGDSDGQPGQVVDPKMQLEDWRVAIAYARSRPEVDPDRIILFGTSFSGGHVTQVGAEDRRVAAIIARGPFLDGPATLGLVRPARMVRVVTAAIRDLVRTSIGRQPLLIDIGGDEGSGALTLADEADFAAMIPEGDTASTRVGAGTALRLLNYRPGLQAPDITAPVLYLLCEKDRLIPIRSSAKLARRDGLGMVPVGVRAVGLLLEDERLHLLVGRVSRPDDDDVGDMPEADPALGPADHVVIALPSRARREGDGVGAVLGSGRLPRRSVTSCRSRAAARRSGR